MVPSNTFLGHFPLDKLFVCQEIDSITTGFTQESDSLPFIYTRDAAFIVDFLDGVPGAIISRIDIGLCL